MKIWNFTATSHGKSVVDGTGENVESLVQCHSMSKSKNKIIVQDAQSFATVAKELLKKTSVHLITSQEIEVYIATNPFEGLLPGLSKTHILAVEKTNVKLWHNAVLYHMHQQEIKISTADNNLV